MTNMKQPTPGQIWSNGNPYLITLTRGEIRAHNLETGNFYSHSSLFGGDESEFELVAESAAEYYSSATGDQ